MVFRVWSEEVPWAYHRWNLPVRFPWWPWCTDVRARVSIFSMNYPPTWSIPHWNLVINGSICWQMFLWLEDWRDLLFRAACNWNCFEGLPACDVKSGDHIFNVLWLMGCLAHFVSFDSCDSLKNEHVHMGFLSYFVDEETEGHKQEGARPGSLSVWLFHIIDCHWCSNQVMNKTDMVPASRAPLLVKETDQIKEAHK